MFNQQEIKLFSTFYSNHSLLFMNKIIKQFKIQFITSSQRASLSMNSYIVGKCFFFSLSLLLNVKVTSVDFITHPYHFPFIDCKFCLNLSLSHFIVNFIKIQMWILHIYRKSGICPYLFWEHVSKHHSITFKAWSTSEFFFQFICVRVCKIPRCKARSPCSPRPGALAAGRLCGSSVVCVPRVPASSPGCQEPASCWRRHWLSNVSGGSEERFPGNILRGLPTVPCGGEPEIWKRENGCAEGSSPSQSWLKHLPFNRAGALSGPCPEPSKGLVLWHVRAVRCEATPALEASGRRAAGRLGEGRERAPMCQIFRIC